MVDSSFAWDSWPVKLGLLGLLLVVRYLLTVSFRGRGAFLVSARESCDSMVLTLAVVFLLLQPFVAQAFWIPTGSMENTLPPGDRILASKFVYRLHPPKAGDVVVFEAPRAALALANNPEGTFYVKRCIGVPGDVVEIRNRVLWRNGLRVSEPYTRWSDPGQALAGRFSYDMKVVGGAVYYRQYDAFGSGVSPWMEGMTPVPDINQAAITEAASDPVPNDSFLMLGDHRNQSSDGHYWGFVPRANVVGKAFAIFWPPQHWGVVDRKSRN